VTTDLIIPWTEIQAGDLLLRGTQFVTVTDVTILPGQDWGTETYTRVDVSYCYPDGNRRFTTYSWGDGFAAVRREVPVPWDAAVTRNDITRLVEGALLSAGTWGEESSTMAKATGLLLGELPPEDWRRLIEAIVSPVWALVKDKDKEKEGEGKP
jgi:hypothetical protein